MSNVTFKGETDKGKARANNEDAYIAQYIWDRAHILAVAIDGVGGYEGGEIAAELARKSIIEYLERYPNGERLELLKQAVIFANNTIFYERQKQPQYANMGCVLTAALIEVREQRINMAHIGDTRLYQFSNGVLTKLSHDHSLVGYREEIGILTEVEAMNHPQRNVIGRDVGSKLLGSSGDDYVEATSFPLISNSMLLLCSDGLSDMITSKQMTSILLTDNNVCDKASMLIDAANVAGGKDNITVVLIDVDIEDSPQIMTFTEEKIDDVENGIERISEHKDDVLKSNNKIYYLLVGLLLLISGYFLGVYITHRISPPALQADPVNYDDYLVAAKKLVEDGHYEKAEVAYNTYKQLTDKTDVKLESIFNNTNTNVYVVFEDKESIIEFISGYYSAIINGTYISYFEEDDITFFDLVQVDRNAIVNRLDKIDKNVEWVYDWSTLNVSKLPSGSIKAVYSFDYYIHYQSRTDRYRITSEMIITTNKLIKSLRDVETHKINSI